jgi:serine phosphatase RsbU (regulator of sigma subunit)/Tfp pilus assembly protein PilF
LNLIKTEIREIWQQARLTCDSDSQLSLKLSKEALKKAEDYSLEEEIILSKEVMAYQIWHGDNLNKALQILAESKVSRDTHQFYEHYDWYAKTVAMIHWGQGNYDVAFQTIYDALSILDAFQSEKTKCLCYWALGVFSFDLKDIQRSLEYYQQSLFISLEDPLLDNNITAYNLIGIGCCKKELGEVDEAQLLFEQALSKSAQYNQWMQRSRCNYELGLIHFEKGNLADAKNLLQLSLKLRREKNLLPGMISCLMVLTEIEKAQGQFHSAISFVNEALDISQKLGSKTKLYQCYEKLASLHKTLQDYQKAFHYLELFHQVRSEVAGEKSNNRIKELETKFSSMQAEKETEIHRLKNVELKEKNEEILSSVKYARYIQNAILPSESFIKKHLKEYFLIYQPKDIVAGDFYWLESHGDKILFAVADCTGHGVPGALMSAMCYSALSRSVKEFNLSDPGMILDKTSVLLKESFSKSNTVIHDGMDIGLCVWDTKSNELFFAGANRSLFSIHESDLIEAKGDRQSIGNPETTIRFTSHKVAYTKNMLIYLFTDGFTDQFGGPAGKKFKTSQLKELLLSIHTEDLEQQEELIRSNLNNWMKGFEQIDDICLMGVKF